MARNHEVQINRELCTGCGLCAKDCVAGAITVIDGRAEARQGGCIECGHCEAICPKNAVTLTGFPEESVAYEDQTRLEPDKLMAAIKTRRSIRVFQQKEVKGSVIKQIIEAGRYAPTGGNSQDTGFIVLGSKQSELEAIAIGMFRKIGRMAKPVMPFLKNMEIDDNFFFKKAPLVIVLTGSAVNASLAAENMAFMAEAHGLGVLYSGFFTMCANRNKKIRAIMRMKKTEKAVTTLVIGYPGVKYHRTVRRDAAKIRKL